MMRRTVLLLVLVISGFQVGPGQSAQAPPRNPPLSLDTSKPIAVNADSFVADVNGETGTYTGSVIVTQGLVRLHADQVKVTAPGGRASRMEATGRVVVDSPSGQAVGDAGIYDLAQQSLRLTGNVVLTKDANIMRGSALDISMETGIARLSGGAQTVAGPQETAPRTRVQGLFVPAQRPNAGTAQPAGNP